MVMKDGGLSIKRGYSLLINVTSNITSEDLLEKAVEKHRRFHKDVVQSNKKAFYQLLYADKNKVSTLAGSDEPFTIKRYKEEIDKPYSRITLACVASVSVEFGSKERPRNGVFGILPARKMGREPKKERWG